MTPREWRKQVAELADDYGYEVTRSQNNHLRLTKPGHPVVFTSGSSSDWRTIKNLRAQLRRNQPDARP